MTKQCRICGNTNLEKILDLGFHPPSDAFRTKKQLDEPETYYPLRLLLCPECSLVQLDYIVPKEVLFSTNYPYETGINEAGIEHFQAMARSICDKYHLGYNDLVVDVGGNDGTLGQAFKDYRHCAVINVDPSDVNSKVLKINKFWNEDVAVYIKHCYGLAKCIMATNVFAHIDNLHAFMRGVDALLAEDGVFVIESPDLFKLIDRLQYDTIYHEHLSYLHREPLAKLFDMYNMFIFDTEETDFHAGSVRYEVKRVPKTSVPT